MQHLDRDLVGRTWLSRGLDDLFCAFILSADPALERQERFLEIMGLEKSLKSVLLHHRHAEYEPLSGVTARDKVTKIGQQYDHKFRKMLDELTGLGITDISSLTKCDFDGYSGNELVGAIEAGYMEARYPVSTPVADRFPIGHGCTHDPLSSSGITKFAYALIGICFRTLGSNIDLTALLHRFRLKYSRREELGRFERLFFQPHGRVTLPVAPSDDSAPV